MLLTPPTPQTSPRRDLTARFHSCLPALLGLCLASLGYSSLKAQPVTTPWGNVAGIQVDGETFRFESALRAVNSDWSGYVQSSKYNWEGNPSFTLEGKTHTCSHFLEGTQLHYSTRVTDASRGSARVEMDTELKGELPSAGIFYVINLPAEDYKGARLELIGAAAQPAMILEDHTGAGNEQLHARAKGFRVIGAKRSLEVVADAETELIVRQDLISQPDYLNDPLPRVSFVRRDARIKVADHQIYLQVLPSGAKPGASSKTGYTLRADGPIDRQPVGITLDASRPGRSFAGIGGNFRMQRPDVDAQVLDYCFENLQVAWGRVAFLWDAWQPEEGADNAAKVLSGGMSPHFYAQIEIARELRRRNIPIIVSVWNPPAWAVDTKTKLVKGQRLDEAKLQKSADSIARWLVFIKQHYGIEAALFSFNETDYGVEVHQTSEEHALANKIIGSTFARHGLITKMLLGDTGAGTVHANRMVDATLADPSILPYLGAVSFHAYHGVTPDALKVWADTAKAANLPLFCDEGGPDSAAHRYPLIFTTPWFAQLEIDQYVRICSDCQAESIMPWQLNADYSPLSGGGVYGDQGPLRPTQRFWNLKQLGLVSRAFWIPASSSRGDVSCAALTDPTRQAFALHLTNNGAGRMATVEGLPAQVRKLRIYVTDATRGMETLGVRGVVNGTVSFPLPPQSFTSLVAE